MSIHSAFRVLRYELRSAALVPWLRSSRGTASLVKIAPRRAVTKTRNAELQYGGGSSVTI
jgi:hypothetical protein